ncbi:C3a anaphylatoxin chemotactic receptor-like [Esox lucius]|uniref:G-protein coupled receptors family 1 profile domain-containing protein n=1 Tax=Esox lucius TaxID=8010 RepID=A0AAY5KYX5_ESOLU|nr:C3a anaphylatoxin chemotactic receptor-like [Esox lucius]
MEDYEDHTEESYIYYPRAVEHYDYYRTAMEDYDYYRHDNFPLINHNICITDGFCIFYLVVNIVTFLVGVLGNGLVIWITGFKMKKTVNTTWYLSLAMSDFIFCVTYLPVYIVHFFDMVYFTFALIFITMFSSVFLLVIISVDCCVSVVFPVWSQTNRTIGKASFVVVLTWVSSVALSTRYMFAGEIDIAKIILSHFIGGFVVPFLIIFFCYSVIIPRLRTRQMISVSSKSLRVMTALIAMLFIFWLPIYFIILFQGIVLDQDIRTGLMVGVILATVPSFLRPVLYVCMGNNVPPTLKRSIVGRIENVLGEEDPPHHQP